MAGPPALRLRTGVTPPAGSRPGSTTWAVTSVRRAPWIRTWNQRDGPTHTASVNRLNEPTRAASAVEGSGPSPSPAIDSGEVHGVHVVPSAEARTATSAPTGASTPTIENVVPASTGTER